MELKTLSSINPNDYALFYKLAKFSVLSQPTHVMLASPNGDKPLPQGKAPLSDGRNFEIVSTDTGELIIAFAELGGFKFNNNVWVCNETTREPVTVRPFVDYQDVYGKPVENSTGFFVFCDSVPIMAVQTQDWRCDSHTYGPRPFNDGVITDRPLIHSIDDVFIYEPILSASGIGHIVYTHLNLTPELDNTFINNAIIPSFGRTLSECLKLVWEWSKTVGDPWNCTDPIAVKAQQFMQVFGLEGPEWDEHWEQNQVPMQVSKYLSGDSNARVRPDGVLPMSDKIQQFVERHSAHADIQKVLDL